MAHRCPTCMANVSDVLGPFCPECGASLREGYDGDLGTALFVDEPIDYGLPVVVADPPDEWWDKVPRCLCSHGPSLHSAITGRCMSLSCGCTRLRLKEAS